jgi:thiol-disulfide isomerase/thioredoxin
MKGLALVLVLVANVAAADMDISFGLASKNFKGKTQSVTFTAPEKHHFNPQSPATVESMIGGKWVKAHTLTTTSHEVKAIWGDNADPCQMRAAFYICDDKNTYCLPVRQNFTCSDDKLIISGWIPEESKDPKDSKEPKGSDEIQSKGKNASEEVDLFIDNDHKAAMARAKEQNKPLLIDFYGIWCPPCNMLNETVFNTAPFEKLQREFVLLKLDADKANSWELKSKYKVRGYPTVVFATSEGDEISRVVGSRDLGPFLDEMKKALKRRNMPFEKIKKQADGGDPKAALELAGVHLERGEYFDAHHYLTRSIARGNTTVEKQNKLLTATLGMYSESEDPNAKRRYAQALEAALEQFPKVIEAIERAGELARVAGDLEDKELEKKAHRLQIKTIDWYLDRPRLLKTVEWTKADLFSVLAGAYDSLEMKKEAVANYEHAAEEYLKLIRKAGLNELSERGYNLERVYCLWKAGKTDIAKAFYEKFQQIYPDDFTFYYQHAQMLKHLKMNKEALAKAQQALERSYGDNRLRVVALVADLYEKLDDKKRALRVLDETLSKSVLPEDKTIRTHRYFDKLKKLKEKLEKA